jgi:DNA-binding transcriptional ArsR family regulator
MAKSGGRPKAKKNAGEAKHVKGARTDKPYEEDDLIRALNHPLRRQILRALHVSQKPLGAARLEEILDLGEEPKEWLGNVSYHVRCLFHLKIASLVDEQMARGAMEHFYVSEVSDVAWVRGLLKRMGGKDEALLWPGGRGPSRKKALAKGGR